MAIVRDQSQKHSTNQRCFAAQNAAMTSSKWYQLGMQMALPIILQGKIMQKTTTNPSAFPANNAGSKCIEVEREAAKNIAQKPVGNQHTGIGGNKPRNGSIETQQTTRDGRYYIPAGFPRNCDHCGEEYTAKRNTSKFCGRRCRVAAHRASAK